MRARAHYAGTWSVLVEATFYVVQDFRSLIVSEIMYHPSDEGLVNGDEYEFVELKNTGEKTLDLTGLQFTDGISFAFTNGAQLAPGNFFVLARNPAAFAARYPGVTVNGVYTGKLDNGGEKLTLSHVLGTNVFSFPYGTRSPWPLTPDGYGFSLVCTNLSGDPALPSGWRASAQPGGSPGADDPPSAIPPVVINEILTHTRLPEMDTIELYNPTATTADIGGWFLSDEATVPTKFRIPDGTVLGPRDFAVFTERDFNPEPGVPPSFALSSLGETLYLFSGDAATNLTGYSDSVEFGVAAEGVSFGRHVTSTGEEQWPAQAALTLGAPNAGPRVGPVVINEIMYHPAADYDEFIELYNLSAAPVPLYDVTHPTNGWRLNGLGYAFPANTIMPPSGFLLLVPIDPAEFRFRYSVAPEVQILGPYSGALQNDGERLSLERPDVPEASTNGDVTVPYIVVDEVRYLDKATWPVGADGEGPSIQRVTPTAYGNDPANWFASGITPGITNILNQPPICTLTAPTNGVSFNARADITLAATATDTDGHVIQVEFFDGDIKVGEATNAPFTFFWSKPSVGRHLLTAKARDNRLAVTISVPVTMTIEPPPVGTGIGLKADYYDNSDFTGTEITVTNPTVDFDWGSGTPLPSIGADTFSVRWTGLVQPRYSGLFTFYTMSDDGVRLWVNDQLLVDNWTTHGVTENLGALEVEAGQLYNVRMDFFENTGGATARLLWSSPFVPKEVIPASQLYPVPLPVILVQPVSQSVREGGTVTFSVVATNNPTAYQWRFNGVALPGENSPSLALSDVQLTDSGAYSVVVSNGLGSVTSASATLTVARPPVIPVQPEDQRASLGANVTFSVSADGTPPFQYQWRFYGTNLVGANGATLRLANVQPAQAGPYNVRVSNIAGSTVSSDAVLTLDTPARILVQPESLIVNSGGTNTVTTNTAVFRVFATGQGPIHYRWSFWATNLPSATNSSLTTTNVGLDDAGRNQVEVTDSVRSVLSDPAGLTVLVRPVIYDPPQPQTVVAGGTAVLSVSAGPIHPTLPLTYNWRRQGTIIETNGASTLVLSNLQSSAYYSVIVSNAYGVPVTHVPGRVTVLADSDGDGLPDEYESAMGLNPTNASDAALDSDGDGLNNCEEYWAGTNPRDPKSVLKVEWNGDGENGALRFYAVSNETYVLERRPQAAAGTWLTWRNVEARATNRTVTIPIIATNEMREFFRLVTPAR